MNKLSLKFNIFSVNTSVIISSIYPIGPNLSVMLVVNKD